MPAKVAQVADNPGGLLPGFVLFLCAQPMIEQGYIDAVMGMGPMNIIQQSPLAWIAPRHPVTRSAPKSW